MIKSKHRNKIISCLLCLLISPVFLIPIIMMVLGSFKTQGEALHMDLSLPEHFMIENYQHVLETGNILRGYKNSQIVDISADAEITLSRIHKSDHHRGHIRHTVLKARCKKCDQTPEHHDQLSGF